MLAVFTGILAGYGCKLRDSMSQSWSLLMTSRGEVLIGWLVRALTDTGAGIHPLLCRSASIGSSTCTGTLTSYPQS